MLSNSLYAQSSLWQQLKENTQYELDIALTTYFQDPDFSEADQEDVNFFGLARIQNQLWFNDEVSLNSKIYAAYSTQSNQYSGVFRSFNHQISQSRYIDFEQISLHYEHDAFTLILGKDFIDVGLAELYSPTNYFNLYDLSNPSQMHKLGVLQVGIDYFIGDDTLSFKILPIYDRSLYPSQKSRWIGNLNDPEFFQFQQNYQVSEQYRDIEWKNIAYLLQYTGSRAGYDFFVLVHRGPSYYPTLQYGNLVSERLKVVPLVTSMSAGVLKVIGQWSVFLETIYQHSDRHQDEKFIRYAIGFSYSDYALAHMLWSQQIKVSLQWSGDEQTERHLAVQVASSSSQSRPFKNALISQIDIEHEHSLRSMLSIIYQMNSDTAILLGLNYQNTDNLDFRLEIGFFDGPKESFFGRWKNNNYLRLRSLYTF